MLCLPQFQKEPIRFTLFYLNESIIYSKIIKFGNTKSLFKSSDLRSILVINRQQNIMFTTFFLNCNVKGQKHKKYQFIMCWWVIHTLQECYIPQSLLVTYSVAFISDQAASALHLYLFLFSINNHGFYLFFIELLLIFV